MNVITVSREYGAGGGEVARRFAAILGWRLLDAELLHEAAALEHLPDAELENLDERAISFKDRFRLHPAHEKYIHGLKEVARQAAARGNVILVGRETSQLVGDSPNALHLRLVAPREWRVARMAEKEHWSSEEALARCAAVDQTRDRFYRYFFGSDVAAPEQYHLIFNTGLVPFDDVVTSVMHLIQGMPAQEAQEHPGKRVLTLSRQLGAGDTGLAPTLALRLDMRVVDRQLIEQQALRLGVTQFEIEQLDEQPSGIFQRFRPGSLHQRYFDALGTFMVELTEQGNVIIVGRAGNRLLRARAEAFHVRSVAPMDVRVRRVMEHRWVREERARDLIAQSDTRRRRFYAGYFGADWASPIEYHLTANSGSLGPAAIELIAFAAERHWTRHYGRPEKES
jgi:cytidylate kinase